MFQNLSVNEEIDSHAAIGPAFTHSFSVTTLPHTTMHLSLMFYQNDIQFNFMSLAVLSAGDNVNDIMNDRLYEFPITSVDLVNGSSQIQAMTVDVGLITNRGMLYRSFQLSNKLSSPISIICYDGWLQAKL